MQCDARCADGKCTLQVEEKIVKEDKFMLLTPFSTSLLHGRTKRKNVGFRSLFYLFPSYFSRKFRGAIIIIILVSETTSTMDDETKDSDTPMDSTAQTANEDVVEKEADETEMKRTRTIH